MSILINVKGSTLMINSIAPTSLYIDGSSAINGFRNPLLGKPVYLFGSGFNREFVTKVYVDNVYIQDAAIMSDSELTFTATPHSEGVVYIFVTNGNTISNKLQLTYTSALSNSSSSLIIDAIESRFGSLVRTVNPAIPPFVDTRRDPLVLIFGSGFSMNVGLVHVGDLVVSPYVVIDTEVGFTAPAHSAGVVDIWVTIGTVSSNKVQLTYESYDGVILFSLDPSWALSDGSTLIDVSCLGLDTDSRVYFDNMDVGGVVFTSRGFAFNAPPHNAGVVNVWFMSGNMSTNKLPLTYTSPQASAPVISFIDPSLVNTNAVNINGAFAINVVGSGFIGLGGTQIYVDNVPVYFVTVMNDNFIRWRPTTHSAGVVDVWVQNGNMSSNKVQLTFANDTVNHQCSLGLFYDPSTNACVQCKPGSYNPTGTGSSCYPCSLGTYSPLYQTVSCDPCPQGQYSNQMGSTACTNCPDGMTWCGSNDMASTGGVMPMPPSSTGTSMQCPPGTMISDDGCQICPANTFSAKWNSKSCSPCPMGTMSMNGSTVCVSSCIPIHSGDSISLTVVMADGSYNLSLPRSHSVNVVPMAMDLLTLFSISKISPKTVLTFDMNDLAIGLDAPYKVWGDSKTKKTIITCTKAGTAAMTSSATISAPTSHQLFGIDPVGSMIDTTGANRICSGDAINIVQGNLFLDVINQSVHTNGLPVYCDNPKSKSSMNPKPKPTTFYIHKY